MYHDIKFLRQNINNFIDTNGLMNNTNIAGIAARVLYLEGANAIDTTRSLFSAYGMSLLDFVEFACELQAASAFPIAAEALWPVAAMRQQQQFHDGEQWTGLGYAVLLRLFDGDVRVQSCSSEEDLQNLFTVDFVARRLRLLQMAQQ
ncbi:MAG: hypothetical protein ABW202_12710 [Duganella sp.]